MLKIITSIILLSISVGLILTGGLLLPILYHHDEFFMLFLSLCGVGLGVCIFAYYIFISKIWIGKDEHGFYGVDFLKLALIILLFSSVFLALHSALSIHQLMDDTKEYKIEKSE